MSRIALDTLASLLDRASVGHAAHGRIPKLAAVGDGDWSAVPAGGVRSIAHVLEYVGRAKWMYESYAFGDASLIGGEPPMTPADGRQARPREELPAWLHAGHARPITPVRALAGDAELTQRRLTNWGERVPTGDLIRTLIAHDSYQAGEINHRRSVCQGDDQWPYGGP